MDNTPDISEQIITRGQLRKLRRAADEFRRIINIANIEYLAGRIALEGRDTVLREEFIRFAGTVESFLSNEIFRAILKEIVAANGALAPVLQSTSKGMDQGAALRGIPNHTGDTVSSSTGTAWPAVA